MQLTESGHNQTDSCKGKAVSDGTFRGPTTPVGRMFDGRSVFVTGASGFIGRVLLEKLIRSYEGIRTIYILMRTKKNQNPLERLHKQLLKAPIFDAIREQPNGSALLEKIKVISGDIGEANLGISEVDMDTMLNDETLSIVFHSAATIKFDEPLKVSVRLNLIATKTIIEFCRKLPNLITVCHVSTAYTNSDLKDGRLIEERLYPMKDKPADLIKMAQIMDEQLMQTLKVYLVDQRPNTYTYTKALAEHMIVEEASDLPIAIVRPTIVVASWRQPLPGWIDNLNGPTGLILAIGKGLLRTMLVNHKAVADVIPVDVVVNTMIASAFHVAVENNKLSPQGELIVSSKEESSKMNTIKEEDSDLDKGSVDSPTQAIDDNAAQVKPSQVHSTTQANNIGIKEETNSRSLDKTAVQTKQPPIIHCNSGQLNPITWGKMEATFFPIIRKYPSCQVLRYPFGSFKSNYYHDLFVRIFVHYLPALMIDLLCKMMGKKPQLLSVYFKLHSAVAALSHFTTHSYRFKTENLAVVRASLSEADQQDLYMDIEKLDWMSFWDDYVHGARKFILKEGDHSLPEARKSFLRAYYIEICMRVLLTMILVACCLPLATYLSSSNVVRAAYQRCCF